MRTLHNLKQGQTGPNGLTVRPRSLPISGRSSTSRSGWVAGLLRSALAIALFAPVALAQGPGGRPGMPGPGGPGGPNGLGGSGGPNGPGMGRGASNGNSGTNPGGPSPASRLPGPAGRWWDNGNYAHSVGLTNDQQRRMDTVFQENRSALISGLDNLRKAQARLDTLSAAGTPSEPAMLTEIQNVAQARADLDKTYTHMTLQIRHEMTNDQINKLEKLK